jgi:hypothetical protein
MNGRLVDEDGNPNNTQIFLNNIDYFYTVRVAAEKSFDISWPLENGLGVQT